jgi:EAL domain-containing protein (putative c-di-GMP-specific phosphodiesterase class I)
MFSELLSHTTKSNVLVVDDEDVVRELLKKILSEGDFNVIAVKGAREALELMSGNHFDTVVADLVMPHMSGLQFLSEVRKRDRELPFIILTGHPTLESAQVAVKESTFRYMTKPCSPEELREAVREAAGLYRLAVLKRQALADMTSGNWKRGDYADVSSQFDLALEGLWVAFQPIVDWPNRNVFGFEALVRSTSATMGNPGLLFDAAERLGQEHTLGRKIRYLVAKAAPEAPENIAIFVNLHSADLADPELYSSSAPLAQYAKRVVLEITERASLERIQDVPRCMAELRALGYRIAVDDLGAGYAGLSSFSQLEPDIVKLDMSLIRGIETSNRKSSIVRSMIAVCTGELRTQVVCEGVETDGEHQTLSDLGATLLQGYLFGKPGKGFQFPDLQRSVAK